ncbi:MAG: hypothetical protein GXX92_04320 [Clostridiales bacterium]|nr:hypothetical protein [Clostridiales bacterium]
MKLHRYLGCVYDLYFEEVNIRFLVHKSLIDEATKDLLLFYVITGYAPDGVRVDQDNNILRFTPSGDELPEMSLSDDDYLWFAL